jgi:hypothetical protein
VRGASTTPDVAPLSGPTASFVGNLAPVNLGVFDYGGFTTASVEVSGYNSPAFRIPRDGTNGNSNWLPDGGWWAWAGPTYVADTFGQCGSPAACDATSSPW